MHRNQNWCVPSSWYQCFCFSQHLHISYLTFLTAIAFIWLPRLSHYLAGVHRLFAWHNIDRNIRHPFARHGHGLQKDLRETMDPHWSLYHRIGHGIFAAWNPEGKEAAFESHSGSVVDLQRSVLFVSFVRTQRLLRRWNKAVQGSCGYLFDVFEVKEG